MTTHPLAATPKVPGSLPPPSPAFTRTAADRIFWRQEWARHWPLWLNGLALWAWLFLVPGETTEESQVLRWSVLWTGLLALVIAGDDLRRGIDPLVRGLALGGSRRWQLRTATVFIGGGVFYLLGMVAAAQGWAHHLWSALASGDFVGHPSTLKSPIEPWQGLGLLALVSALGCLATAQFNGPIAGIVYAGALWLTAHGVSGSAPLIFEDWIRVNAEAPGGRARDVPAPKVFGVAWWVVGAVVWAIGCRHAARRAPLTSAASGGSILLVAVGLIGALAIIPLAMYTLFGTGAAVPARVWRPTAGWSIDVLSPQRVPWWTTLAWLQAVYFMIWWGRQFRARHVNAGRLPGWRALGVPGFVAAALALGQLAVQPTQTFGSVAPELVRLWPRPKSDLIVRTSQTWESAYQRPNYLTTPTAYDLLLWSHYPGRYDEPLALISGEIAIPTQAQGRTTADFVFPSCELAPEPTHFQVRLQRQNPRPPTHEPGPGVIVPQLSVSMDPIHPPSRTTTPKLDLTADFEFNHFMPKRFGVVNPDALGKHLAYSIALIPQRPAEPAVERPWQDAIDVGRAYRHRPSKPDFPPGLKGLTLALAQTGEGPVVLLLMPMALLAGLLLVHCRLGGLILVALAAALLVVYIHADARRIEGELTLSANLDRPEYQRDLARAYAAISFFHRFDIRHPNPRN